MELNEKLQELRKRKGLTQEELAGILHVSRAAVSKWESGRGCPSIDSLKDIAEYFSVSLDELLSSESLLALAEDEGRKKAERNVDTAIGLTDCAMLMLAVLPVFGLSDGASVLSVTLPSLLSAKPMLFAVYAAAIATVALLGIATLFAAGLERKVWHSGMRVVSQALTCVCVLVFIATQQPYAAATALAFLAMKMFMLMRRL